MNLRHAGINSRWALLVVLPFVVALAGCLPANVGADPHNTGGGGISPYEGHSARTKGGTGTGSSATARGQGPVDGTGAPAEPGNVDSPSESNGGAGKTSQ